MEPIQLKPATGPVAHEDPFAMHMIDDVQLRGAATGDVHAAAAEGISGASSALPHLDRIQASFGEHDVSGIGDAYERQADAVADAVVNGESAAALLGGGGGSAGGDTSSVQRQPAPAQGGATTVDVTVDWRSPFGDTLTGTVTLYGRNSGGNTAWTRIDSKQVAAVGSTTFTGADRYRFYKAKVQPADDIAGDDQAVGQFTETTLTSGAVDADATTATVGGGMNLNRWNHENVEQRHEREGIDPAMTGDANMRSTPLFGRRVRVHRLIVARVESTNALYEAMSAEEKDEIGRSLFVTGGYAYRNQTGNAGAFSDHSVGMAIDVNYNEGKTQNALMEKPAELDLLNLVVQPVVQSDPAHAGFNIWTAQGQAQLEASQVFNTRFPRYLAELMQRNDEVASLDTADANVIGASTPWTMAALPLAVVARLHTVSEVMQSISKADIDDAAAAQTDDAKKKQLETIAKFWDSINAWVLGTTVTDERHKDADGNWVAEQNKTAVGMIPLDSRVLQMFLDTGWSWGGNWGVGVGRKDYMHFEDESLMDQIRLEDE